MARFKGLIPSEPLRRQLADLRDGAHGVGIDRRLVPILVTSAQVVSAASIGETVSFAAVRRAGLARGAAPDDVGVIASSLDGLPYSRRGPAMKSQPELRRALAVRSLNAASVYMASGFLQFWLRHHDDDVPVEAAPSARARAALRPFVSDPRANDAACEVVASVNRLDVDVPRWRAVLQVAEHLLEAGSVSHDVGRFVKTVMTETPDRPISHLRHAAFGPVLACLTMEGASADRLLRLSTICETWRRELATGVQHG